MAIRLKKSKKLFCLTFVFFVTFLFCFGITKAEIITLQDESKQQIGEEEIELVENTDPGDGDLDQDELAREQEEDNYNPVLDPPEVILNDQKLIFKTKPILDNEGWLFPLEEVAEKLQDKVSVDLINKKITIDRTRDKSTVILDVNNGTVIVNNRPFRTLFGYNRIILGHNVQMVPTSALVILLGLTSIDTEEGTLVLKNVIGTEAGIIGTIEPPKRTKLKELLVDYFTVTNTFDYLKTSELYTRKTEINSGFHNDAYSLTSDFIVKAGTDAPILNFDSANLSYFKTSSPLQVHVGDKPLSLIKSPLLGGLTIRGIQVQNKGPLKESNITFSTGVLPSSAKVLGKGLTFVRYGRLAEILEIKTSPKNKWQFSLGEATYSDFIVNQLTRGKQTGGLLAASATKDGEFIEADLNLGIGTASRKQGENEAGPAADLLFRFKPKKWLSLYTKGSYYAPGFYSLSGNPYYNDRDEATFGADLNLLRSNIGISESFGKFDLDNKKPGSYEVKNVNISTTPLKNGPTVTASYSENSSRISPNRALDKLLFPLSNIENKALDLEDLIERRTTSFFRASVLKSFPTANFSAGINKFTFSNTNPLKLHFLGGKTVTELTTYDLNLNKSLNHLLGIQSYLQGSELYKQVKFGLNIGQILGDKLNLQLASGALLQKNKKPSPIYGFNINYKVNKKNLFSVNLDKTAFLTNISALWQYNMRPSGRGYLHEDGVPSYAGGRIRGRVVVLEEGKERELSNSKIILPALNRERGITNVRIHLGNYTIVTDQTGSFEFPSLTPGIHRIRLEYSDIPSYLTAITPEYVDVKVESGKESTFNFVLAYFGSVSGKITLLEEQGLELEELPELQDIRVYLDNSEFETLTNTNGSFTLGDVKPGKYKVKIDPDFLPEELEAAEKEIEIEVKAKGETKNIILPLKHKEKELQIKEF